MVSVVHPSVSGRSLLLAQLMQSRLMNVLLRVNAPHTKLVLTKAAAAGSAYAALALLLGGFYENWWQLPAVALRVAYTISVTLSDYALRGFKPLFSEWTLSFEVTRAVARCLMSVYGRRMVKPKNAKFICKQSEVFGTLAGFFATRQFGVHVESFLHNGLEHLWLRSTKHKTQQPRQRVVVLYIHGGGFALLSPRMYIPFGAEFLSRIDHHIGMDHDGVSVEILLANYRKTPEHPHPTPPEDAFAMYKYLIEHQKLVPSQIIVAGDSAGGSLTLTTLLRVRDEDPELLPLAAVLSCPFADLEAGGDERKAPYCILAENAGRSFNAAYVPNYEQRKPWGDASPVHCDLRGLPPVYIQAAELDFIFSHSKRLMERSKEDGLTTWELEVFPNVPHVFTTFPSFMVPSAAKGIDKMAQYAAGHFVQAIQKAKAA